MAAIHVGRKRSRSHEGKPRVRQQQQQQQQDPYAMVVDDDDTDSTELVIEHDPGDDADREDGDDDAVETYFSGSDSSAAPPRRKRAMLIKANIQFLQKLPPLFNYQRSAYGRRGGVDGGAPDGDMSMTALEASMGESSVSAASRSWFAAAVAPVATSSRQQQQMQMQATAIAYPQVHNVRRNASIAFASHAPRELIQQQQHRSGRASADKDDEARPATTGSHCW